MRAPRSDSVGRRAPLAALLVLVGVGLGVGVTGQEPTVQAPPAAQARRLFDELAESLAEVAYTRANYVQTRRSDLLAEPLVSKGRLYCRREPALLLFEVSEPRSTRIWVQDGTYQVYRPEQARAERFLFDSNPMWRALLYAFSPRAGELEEWFELRGIVHEDGVRTVTFEPRAEETRRYLRRFWFSVLDGDLALTRLGYVDASGDEIEITLTGYDRKPELEAPEALFSLELPEGVRLETTRVREM